MSDQTIIVKGNGTIFLGGPPLVKAATGEVISAQALGGADVHCRVSGVTDYMANDEVEACQICREILEYSNLEGDLQPSRVASTPAEEPLYDCGEIAGIIPEDSKKSFDVREIIARIVDGSRFMEFKKDYGTTMVTGFASLYSMPVGIVANNGILFSESTLKALAFDSCRVINVLIAPCTCWLADCVMPSICASRLLFCCTIRNRPRIRYPVMLTTRIVTMSFLNRLTVPFILPPLPHPSLSGL